MLMQDRKDVSRTVGNLRGVGGIGIRGEAESQTNWTDGCLDLDGRAR